MKNLILTVFAFLFSCTLVLGQGECGVAKPDSAMAVALPWYSNNQYLYDLIDSIHHANNSGPLFQQGQGILPSEVGGLTETFFQVPVKNWIFHNDDGTTPALEEFAADEFANYANRELRENPRMEAGIMFYTHCDEIEHFNSTGMNMNGTRAQYETAAATLNTPFMLDVHFVSVIPDPPNPFVGLANWPWEDSRYAFIMQTEGRFRDPRNATTYLHEIGHCLGLFHTDENPRGLSDNNGAARPCFQEFVERGARNRWRNGCVFTHDRLKCSLNGDLLCDTDANPGINEDDRNEVGAGCAWRPVFTAPDPNDITPADFIWDGGGTRFFSNGRDNALRNFMTPRLPRACRTELSPLQIGVMYQFLLTHRERENGVSIANNPMFYANPFIDAFENDNFPETATVVDPLDGERQHHTFHQSSRWDGEAVQFTNVIPIG